MLSVCLPVHPRVSKAIKQNLLLYTWFKGTLHFFLEIGSFYNSPRVKQLFTVFESVQPISESGGSTFSLA